MKKALVLVAALAMVASASATIQIFFTAGSGAYGLANSANIWKPSLSQVTSGGVTTNGNDATDTGSGVPYSLLGGNVPAAGDSSVALSDFVYVWVKFVPTNEPTNAKIQGMDLIPSLPLAQASYYAMNDNDGDNAARRWDGEIDATASQFAKTGEQVLVAVQTAGLKNSSNAVIGWNLGKSKTFLLAAIKPAAAGVLTYSLGIKGIGLDSFGGDPVQTQSAIASITVTPEPASMLLLGLAGLLIRRR